jgi:hypothetical protein
MSDSALLERPVAGPAAPPWYRDDLLPELQRALGELADIELRYEKDCDHIRASAAPEPIRRRLADELVDRYHAERRPCLERLTRLHKQMIASKFRDDLYRANLAG